MGPGPIFPTLRARMSTTPPQAPAKDKDNDGDWLIPLGVLALCLVLAIRFVGDRPFGLDNDTSAQWVQFAISLGALYVIGWGLKLQWQGRPKERQLLRDRTLVALGLCGFFAYFNFGHLHFGNFVHVWDTYHYVMGAKYFPELGYEKLYDCAAVANTENGRRDEVARQTITDLRTNVIIKTDEILAHPERCKESFSPERWIAFKKDIAAFRSFVGESRWRDIHLDHGYNATPVWTLAGYALTNSGGPVTMAQLTQLNLIDPIYLALTLAMIWWAFGPARSPSRPSCWAATSPIATTGRAAPSSGTTGSSTSSPRSRCSRRIALPSRARPSRTRCCCGSSPGWPRRAWRWRPSSTSG